MKITIKNNFLVQAAEINQKEFKENPYRKVCFEYITFIPFFIIYILFFKPAVISAFIGFVFYPIFSYFFDRLILKLVCKK